MTDYNHCTDWYYEGQISRKLVQYLQANGYKIIKDNSDNPSARGEDIIAMGANGIKEIIEVKGYPTEFHTKGKKKGQAKPTNPRFQAKHWFSEAILSSIFNYRKHRGSGQIVLALVFPLFDRYKDLVNKVEDYFTDNNIDLKIYFIDELGNVTLDNFCVHKRIEL